MSTKKTSCFYLFNNFILTSCCSIKYYLPHVVNIPNAGYGEVGGKQVNLGDFHRVGEVHAQFPNGSVDYPVVAQIDEETVESIIRNANCAEVGTVIDPTILSENPKDRSAIINFANDALIGAPVYGSGGSGSASIFDGRLCAQLGSERKPEANQTGRIEDKDVLSTDAMCFDPDVSLPP